MKKRFMVMLLTSMTVLSVTGCGKKNTDITVQEQVTDAPDGYVNNGADLEKYTEAELYFSVGDERMAVREESLFSEGDGFQFRFVTNVLSTDPAVNPNDNNGAISIANMKDQIENFKIAGETYTYDDLCRSGDQGFEVLKMFSEDFGVIKFDSENNTVEHLGNLTDEASLKDAYSEKQDYEDYSVLCYRFDAKMNNLDDTTYDKYRDAYTVAYGVDTGVALDGTLAVMIRTNTEGMCIGYDILLEAPTYWNSEENFNANMNVMVRRDITNCHMLLTDGVQVGFVNNVAISCTK